MPISKKWKVVGGSVSAAVLLGGGIATADLGDAPGRIALDDQVPVSEVVMKAADSSDSLLASLLDDLAQDDDSLDSPFDESVETPDDDETVDSPDDDETVDSPDDNETVDSPEDDETVDSPDDDDTVDSPEDDETVDSPDDDDTVDSPEDDESVDSPDDDDESVDSPDSDD